MTVWVKRLAGIRILLKPHRKSYSYQTTKVSAKRTNQPLIDLIREEGPLSLRNKGQPGR